MFLAQLLTVASILGFTSSVPLQDANLDRWCGKAYRPSDPAIDPGGRIDPPRLSGSPLLDLKIQPRHSIYLEKDSDAAFVVDTSLSQIHGEPYTSATISLDEVLSKRDSAALNTTRNQLSITITRVDTGSQIASSKVPVNASDNLVPFSLKAFPPSSTSYRIQVTAKTLQGQTYKAWTNLYRLNNPKNGGSVTKIDNLYGALLVQQNGKWTPLLPYSFYMGSGWFKDPASAADYAKLGYNIVHIIPPYDLDWFDKFVDEAEKVGLWIMYDMRHTYQSKEQVSKQVTRYKDRKNMLLWYTADEPDGVVDPVDAPKKSYDFIKTVDPYHPVSLVLNCANYFFEEYSSGADILLSDVYPIGNNNEFSTQYHTVCNATYGCCGCDNCYGTDDLTNVPSRLDSMSMFQTQLGQSQKPLWSAPQAFGASEFWKRVPTMDEEVAMTMLGVNHGAKGVVMWTWPTTDELKDATSKLAKVLTQEAAQWILGAKHVKGLNVKGGAGIDASAWLQDDEALICVVNPSHSAQKGQIVLQLPKGVSAVSIGDAMWGDKSWRIGAQTQVLTTQDMPALAVGLFTVKIKTDKAVPSVQLVRPSIEETS